MRCLPALVVAGQPLSLPLCDSTAEALLCTLLADDDAAACESLAAAMAVDPPFTLWCAICVETSTTTPSLNQLAARIATKLLANLTVDEKFGDFDTEQLIQQTVSAVHLAHQASIAAGGSQEDFLRQAAYTRGLLPSTISLVNDEQAAALEEQLGVVATKLPPSDDAATDEEIESLVREHWTRHSAAADRLFTLARKLDHVSKIESDFADQLQEEKLQALYTLAAGAGHEINNPLGSIAGRAQLLMRDEADPQRRRTLAKINSQAFRAHEMIADMMLFARPPKPNRTDVDLATLAADVMAEFRDEAAERSTVMTFSPPTEPVHAAADGTQLAVALRAMCTNSLEAMGSGGQIEITTRNIEANGCGPRVQLEVRDDGPGIDPALHSQLFDPFYSGREAGRGLGFGLSKCWRIITNHGGEIRVDSEIGRGATFTLTLPATLDEAEHPSLTP